MHIELACHMIIIIIGVLRFVMIIIIIIIGVLRFVMLGLL
jgi:hypothetical protein